MRHVWKLILIILFGSSINFSLHANTTVDNSADTVRCGVSAGSIPRVTKINNEENNYVEDHGSRRSSVAGLITGAGHGAAKKDSWSIIWLLIQSIIAGLLAVFTPYIYTILPFTVGYLSSGAKTKADKLVNALCYAASLMLIFTILGIVISVIVQTTGLLKLMDNWIVNLFFCRYFLVLGISFMGAINVKLPASWVNSIASKARAGSFRGIFFMALSLPGASFSSTIPIAGLVLGLSLKVSVFGPAIGLFGFSIGLALPFVFPAIIDLISASKSLLNNIRVVLGLFCMLLALKFLSNADISLKLGLIDRELFIGIWMLFSAVLGVYMMGKVKLFYDYTPEHNIYGQEYVTLFRLFVTMASFTFALYLLPGLWGAPLHFVNGFLPR